MALGLAVVFAVSFAFLGVGSGMPGMDFSQLWTGGSGGGSSSSGVDTPEDLIESYEAQLAEDPENYNALVGLALQYEALDQNALAAQYLEKALELQPDNASLHKQLAEIYLDPVAEDDEAAVRVLNRLTELEPENAEAFLQLGVAQRNLGNTQAAILAWNHYLELAPEGETSETVRAELEQLTAQPGESAQPTEDDGATDTTATTAGG